MTSMLDAPPHTEPPAARWVPRVDVLTAARRHWLIVLVVTALLTGVGVFAATLQNPVYTGEARLAVGRIDVSAPGAIATFATATTSLASQYSRGIDARGVTSRAARGTGLTPAQVADHVSATPVPQSPVIRVIATGTTGQQAVLLANKAGYGLVGYTTALNRSNPDADRLLRQFKTNSAEVVRLRARVGTLRRRQVNTPSARTRSLLNQEQVNLEVAQLRLTTVRSAYDAATSSQASTQLVQMLTPASSASSNRSRRLQLYGFIGFAAGLALGLALATLRANSVVRRSLRG
jgi:capsular polysaccharide biosynthesis protein